MPIQCEVGGEWRYTQKEMDAGAPGGIAPAPVEEVSGNEASDEAKSLPRSRRRVAE
jgi:hypothetical protein